jgi:HSP20 family molecular chaperone IbpA
VARSTASAAKIENGLLTLRLPRATESSSRALKIE